jgi:hypothetical protein
MKFFAVPLLIALLMTQSFSKWMIMLEYRMNTDFISKNLCINKDRPLLHCHGKCQMMKKMAEEEKQDAPAQAPVKLRTGLNNVLFCTDNHSILPQPAACLKPHPFSHYLLKEYEITPPPIFHPPLSA